MSHAWALGPREAHVWHLAADTEADAPLYDRWWEILSHDERARASRFVFPADRRRFVLAHGALRVILSRYTRTPPARLTFEANAYGRPELSTAAGARLLRFNLSHTRGLIALAVCREYEVGVDVECAWGRSTADLIDLAARFFSPPEAAALRRLPDEERLRRFLQLWTLKEAYIKAYGLGLSIPLDAFSFDLTEDSRPVMRIDPSLRDEADEWRFAAMQPTPGHLSALAVRAHRDDPRIIVRVLAPFDLA